MSDEKPLSYEEARDQLARASVMALSYVAQSARGIGVPAVPQSRIDEADTITERFMVRWRGDPDPAHVKAIDAYWVSAAEHWMNASTFTARVITSTGADVAVLRTVRVAMPAAQSELAAMVAETLDAEFEPTTPLISLTHRGTYERALAEWAADKDLTAADIREAWVLHFGADVPGPEGAATAELVEFVLEMRGPLDEEAP